jgi:hypothetical protein
MIRCRVRPIQKYWRSWWYLGVAFLRDAPVTEAVESKIDTTFIQILFIIKNNSLDPG